jgi:hypothetical protein
MPYPYPLYNTTFSNVTGVYDLVKIANDTTGTYLVVGLLIAVFFTLFLTLKGQFDTDEILSASGWVCFILALLARFADLANLYPAIIFLVISAAATFYMVVTKRY